MTTDLFEEEQSATPSEFFEREQPEREVIDTTSSDKNLVAQAAIISGEDLEETYFTLSNLSPEERQVAIGNISKQAGSRRAEENLDTAAHMIATSDISEEGKAQIIQSLAGKRLEAPDSMKLAAESLYIASTGKETEEEERRLANIGEVIDPVVDLLKEQQRVVNLLSVDEGTGEQVSIENNLGDMAELFLPFTEQVYANQIRNQIESGEIGNIEELFNFVLLGEGKIFSKEAFASAPIEVQMEFLRKAPEIFNKAKSLVFTNDNDLLQLDNFLSMTQEGYYTTTDRVIDDVVGVLDLMSLGWVAKPLAKAARLDKLAKMAKVKLRRTASKKQPASVQSLSEQVNPEVAKQTAKIINDDVTGEAAEALAGTSRTDAQMDMFGPQVRVEDESITAAPYALDRDILEAAYEGGGSLSRTPKELYDTMVKVRDDLKQVGSLVSDTRATTSAKTLDDGSIAIKEVYVTANGGFTSAKEAIKETLSQLKYYGVGKENLVLMRRVGNEYVPTTVKEVEGKAIAKEELDKKGQPAPDGLKKEQMVDDFAVAVEWNYQPRSIDISRDKEMSPIRNWMDRLSPYTPTPGKGTALRYVLPASAILPVEVFQGSVAAVDKGNRLQKLLMDKARKGLYEPLEALPAEKSQLLSQVMFEQNMARKVYGRDELAAMGITSSDELAILDNWKYLNDQLWHLTNRDLAKTLRNQGYSFYTDTVKEDHLIGKVVNPKLPPANRPSSAFNPDTGKVEIIDDWDNFHNAGSQVFELRNEELFELEDGTQIPVAHIKVTPSATRSTKMIEETDDILPYIPGWSHVRYKDGLFIERQLVDKNGVDVGKPQAILTSPDVTSADKAVEMFSANARKATNGQTYRYYHRNANELDPIAITERQFDVSTFAGLSSQRKRGQTLQSFSTTRSTDLTPNIANPLDSFKSSVAELSRRVPMREYLDELEQRIVDTYGRVLPKDEYGTPRMPTGKEKLQGTDKVGGSDAKLRADAKSMIEHYNYMKYGYHNTIDEYWKTAFNKLGDVAGAAASRIEKSIKAGDKGKAKRGVSKVLKAVERTAKATPEEVPSIMGFLRGQAFNAHIAASSPPSQWLVQGLPAFTNALLHPKYVFSGEMVSDWRKLVAGIMYEGKEDILRKQFGNKKAEEILSIKRDWDRSGLGAGIDKHLIVENGIEQIIETTRFKPLKGANEALFGTLREVGFDKGEMFNLGSFWLAARNDAIKKGGSMSDAKVADAVRAKTRALTMNMNKAGEMPWNKDSLSLFTQFMISPYKSMMMYLDRGLNSEEKAKIAAWQFLMMPLPTAVTYNIRAKVGIEGGEGDIVAETISNGLFGGMVNTVANAMFEDAGSASWERLTQFDTSMAGYFSFLEILAEDEAGGSIIGKLAQSSPALSMYTGYNPIAVNLMKSFGQLVSSPVMEGVDPLTSLHQFAGPNGALWQYTALTRGLSTGYKELLVQEYGKRYSAMTGKVKDPSITVPDTFAKAVFGMGTTYEAVSRRANKEVYESSREAMNDIDLLFKEYSKQATDLGFNMDDPKRAEYILRQFAAPFEGGVMPSKLQGYVARKVSQNKSLRDYVLSNARLGGEEGYEAARLMKDYTPELLPAYEFLQTKEAYDSLKGDD